MGGNVMLPCTDCGGDSEEIKTGAAILDYITEIGNIQEKIQEAYTYAETCVQIVGDTNTYQGAARAELEAFFQSLASNLQKMVFLYQAAAAYIQNAYNTMYYNEQQLVDWIISQMGEV